MAESELLIQGGTVTDLTQSANTAPGGASPAPSSFVVGVSSTLMRDASLVSTIRSGGAEVRPAFDPGCDLTLVATDELSGVHTGVVVLAAGLRPGVAEARRALGLGANGIVDTAAGADVLVAAFTAAASGITVLPADIAPVLLARLEEPSSAVELGPADLELLQDLASGMTLDEVALLRDRSTRTIRRDLRDLWRRMGVRGRAPGLVLAARWGLVD